ncbi:thiamine/thiamine pyrophosphate ABC transporter, permease protein [Aureimonas endophytica]|uniref:Thiamine/thiamine pyrophosphate ABC transporter, permease protein n=1 Tax=Aureimonas endophytica TaxID=2027858 RepID=A0A917A0E8_9HYPH|nr:thiamine/thiamine pyrophosphate ABC transporter permease ThiP [Aureimonas endophytica]GGE21131.1 thiamine/thiamine pyrophosphate ABC transporter, permease protein [Aureimonas endophytica]
MAEGARPLTPRPFPDPDRAWKLGGGLAAALAVWLFLGLPFAALLTQAAEGDPTLLATDAYLRGVVLFTLEQAALSALLSVAGAVPLALALHRTRFPGRGLVLRLFLLPQALPVLVGALGILALWGRAGLVSEGLAALGLPRLDIYGLPGILLAHVFFNLPLATRLLYARLDAVPAESWRLAGQLALPAATTFRLIEMPALREGLAGAASLTFMICVTSFTLVLVLGGGPGATTLEVEIYQALRTDFDPGRAVILALAQIVLTGLFLLVATRLGPRLDAAFTLGRPARRFDRRGRALRLLDAAAIALGLAFVLSPFVVVVLRGLGADLLRLLGEAAVRDALLTSAAIGFAASCLALVFTLSLLFAREAWRGSGRVGGTAIDLSASLVLVVPPIVTGAGWFLLLRRWTDAFALAPILVVTTNAVMAMPFLLRLLGPPLTEALARHRRLADHLGLRGWSRLRHVEGPALAGPLALGFALALSLSLGDLGVVALFGNENFVTLPYLLYQRMGSYRTMDASGLALILGTASLVLVALAEGFALSRTRNRR